MLIPHIIANQTAKAKALADPLLATAMKKGGELPRCLVACTASLDDVSKVMFGLPGRLTARGTRKSSHRRILSTSVSLKGLGIPRRSQRPSPCGGSGDQSGGQRGLRQRWYGKAAQRRYSDRRLKQNHDAGSTGP
ncbi:hypothetical protein E2562_003674 [Oryza meyeriana var. granulata]|uniref:Uncharacterized protein n=1 Tax=Oryza meyeriana var. granulata TaxID=110450 RepID=A0A6G1C3M6_9ORYZ|nr:hypothetical protein E2562_003674 [Oryza meyeriana var. granulata]